MSTLCRRLVADRSGATAIEYALIASLMAIGAILGVSAFGASLDTMWTYVGSNVASAMGG